MAFSFHLTYVILFYVNSQIIGSIDTIHGKFSRILTSDDQLF